jgi:hypothetical protein
VKPDPRGHAEFIIADPACGTGGVLDRDLGRRVRQGTTSAKTWSRARAAWR